MLWPIFVLAQGCVDINTGSLTQLEELDGVGPTKAQAMIDSRPYSSIDDLDRAKGIGPATLAKIKAQGLASINCSITQTTPMPKPAPTPVPTPTPNPTSTPAVTYPGGVYINEILPNPQGADQENEWIELYNQNNFDVDLSNWQLKDTVGSVKIFTIPTDTKILTNGFLIFKRPDTKIMLNNDQDGLLLINPLGNTVDSIIFLSAPLGQSYNLPAVKPAPNWSWSTSLTPGYTNIITIPIPKTSSKPLSETKKSVKNINVDLALANLTQNFTENQPSIKINNPRFLFFIALVTAIISALAVLLIKFKFKALDRANTKTKV